MYLDIVTVFIYDSEPVFMYDRQPIHQPIIFISYAISTKGYCILTIGTILNTCNIFCIMNGAI